MRTPNNYPQQFPSILQRYVSEVSHSSPDQQPRRVRRRFHGLEVTLWEGRVNVADVSGWVENIRLKYFLNRWHARAGNSAATPTTEDIYEIMLDADKEEPAERKKPFHIARIADSIALNNIQEPIIIFAAPNAATELWDGNRRFYGTVHIMKEPSYKEYRERAQWVPALIYEPSGDPQFDERVKHSVITELNFVEKDHIPWPAYVKAEKIYDEYHHLTSADPIDPTLSRTAKTKLASDYGLKGWRVADRWIKMYELASQFKEYHEEEHHRDEVEVDLRIQEKFEYFDELSKPGVWGPLSRDTEARDEVFNWLWDDKFKSFADVRRVPSIIAEPVARRQANAPDSDGVKRAIETVIANDPARQKDPEAANEKIKQFANWLDSFRRGDYRQIESESLELLKEVLQDVIGMLEGLLSTSGHKSQ
jgi:hypothetical protein